MEPSERVRLAQPDDEPQLMELCRRRHSECGLGMFAPDKVRSVIRRSFDRGCNDPSVIGIVGLNQVEGSAGFVCEADWDSDTPILRCLWNYVLPEYRNSTNLKDLTEWGSRLSRHAPFGLGIPIRMEAITTRRTESQIRLYKRQLGEPVAIAWVCESYEFGAP